MDDAAEADFVGSAVDRVVNLTHPHQLEHLHPVPQVVEHEHEVVVVLECLAFHPWDHFNFILGICSVIHQFADFVLHEAGELDVEIRIRGGDGFENLPQIVLIEFGEFREAVVGEQVGQFFRFTGIVLFVHGDRRTTNQEGRFQTTMSTDNQPRPLRHGDRIAPALFIDDRGEKLDLVGAVPVRIHRVRLELIGVNEGGVGAMDWDGHVPAPESTRRAPTLTPVLRSSVVCEHLVMDHAAFANLLRTWREKNHYSQRDAAEVLRVSKRSLENWEQERAMPQGFGLRAMLEIIQVKRKNRQS